MPQARPRAQRRRRRPTTSSPRPTLDRRRRRRAPACGAAGAKQTEYLRIVSTVTSAIVGARIAPVKIESLVAPPVSGSLVVKVSTARNVGVSTSRSPRPTPRPAAATPARPTATAARCSVGVEIGDVHDEHQHSRATSTRPPSRTPTTTTTVTPNLVNVVTMTYDIAVNMQVNVKTLKPGTAFTTSATTYPRRRSRVSDNAADQARCGPSRRRRRRPRSTPSNALPVHDRLQLFTGDLRDPEPGQGRALDQLLLDDQHGRGGHRRPPKPQPQVATVYQPALNLRIRAATSSRNSVDDTRRSTPARHGLRHLRSRRRATRCADFQGAELDVKNWPAATWGTLADANRDRELDRPERHRLRSRLPFGTYKVCLNDGTRCGRTRHGRHRRLRQHEDRADDARSRSRRAARRGPRPGRAGC